jgi:ribosomal protein S18 acetylase RimI-like enzyme
MSAVSAVSIARPVAEHELEALAELERAVFGDGAYPFFFFRQAFDALGATLLVVGESGAPLAGYVLGSLAAGEKDAWIWSLAVSPDRRSEGHARALLDACEQTLFERGAEGVRLHVSPTNTHALALYERRGYVEIDFVKDAFGPGGDRKILRRAR